MNTSDPFYLQGLVHRLKDGLLSAGRMDGRGCFNGGFLTFYEDKKAIGDAIREAENVPLPIARDLITPAPSPQDAEQPNTVDSSESNAGQPGATGGNAPPLCLAPQPGGVTGPASSLNLAAVKLVANVTRGRTRDAREVTYTGHCCDSAGHPVYDWMLPSGEPFYTWLDGRCDRSREMPLDILRILPDEHVHCENCRGYVLKSDAVDRGGGLYECKRDCPYVPAENVNERTLRRLREASEAFESGDLSKFRVTKMVSNEDGSFCVSTGERDGLREAAERIERRAVLKHVEGNPGVGPASRYLYCIEAEDFDTLRTELAKGERT